MLFFIYNYASNNLLLTPGSTHVFQAATCMQRKSLFNRLSPFILCHRMKLKSYVKAPHSHCMNCFLACGRECWTLGKNHYEGFGENLPVIATQSYVYRVLRCKEFGEKNARKKQKNQCLKPIFV